MSTLVKVFLFSVLISGLSVPAVQADPPRWAPAHGYRHKNQQLYRYHYDRYQYPRYNYRSYHNSGSDSEIFGTVIGGTLGSAIGSSTSRDPAIGAFTGAVVGAILGNVIGRSLDDGDRRYTRDTRPRINTDNRSPRR